MITTDIPLNLQSRSASKGFDFQSIRRDGKIYLLLVDLAVLGKGRPWEAHYVMEFDTEEQFFFGAKWVAERRDRWQAWGALGTVSREALGQHMRELLEAEPLDPAAWGHMLRVEEDGCTLGISKHVMARFPADPGARVWRRKFASPAKCQRARGWFYEDQDRIIQVAHLAEMYGDREADAYLDGEMKARQRVKH